MAYGRGGNDGVLLGQSGKHIRTAHWSASPHHSPLSHSHQHYHPHHTISMSFSDASDVDNVLGVPCRFWVRSDRPNLAYDGNPRNRSRPSVRRNIVKIRRNIVEETSQHRRETSQRRRDASQLVGSKRRSVATRNARPKRPSKRRSFGGVVV